jgi:hypothetical protein
MSYGTKVIEAARRKLHESVVVDIKAGELNGYQIAEKHGCSLSTVYRLAALYHCRRRRDLLVDAVSEVERA